MIFVTIGTQAPFDRLIKVVDELAEMFPEKEFIVQIFHGKYTPRNLKFLDFIPPTEFEQIFNKAELIIGHAGMGTIISALTMGKPIIILPRIAANGEHRNDHQVATAEKMDELGYVRVAKNEEDLKRIGIDLLSQKDPILPFRVLGSYASTELLNSISGDLSNFINE